MNNNWILRVTVAVYAFITTILSGIVMLAPFGDKEILSIILLVICDILMALTLTLYTLQNIKVLKNINNQNK